MNRMVNKKAFLIIALFVLITGQVYAGDYYHLRKPVQHYLNISVGGGGLYSFRTDEGKITPPKTILAPDKIDGLGGTSAFGISYEIRYHKFFFNVGVGIDGDFPIFKIGEFRDTTLVSWVRNYTDGSIILNQDYAMEYIFSNYKEIDQEWRLSVPVQFGYLFNSYVYAALGVKYGWTFADYAKGTTDIRTEIKRRPDYTDNLNEAKQHPECYGLFEKQGQSVFTVLHNDIFKDMGDYPYVGTLSFSPEVGARLPIAYRTILRVGLFLEYDIPIRKTVFTSVPHMSDEALWDYWKTPMPQLDTDGNPVKDNNGNIVRIDGTAIPKEMDDLNKLECTPVRLSDWTEKGFQAFSFGIRATLSINITPSKHWCNCEKW